MEDEEGQYEEQKQLKLLDVEMARVKPPEGDELYLLTMPDFLGIKHRSFDPATYEPPTKPHDGRDMLKDTAVRFSPYSTANTSVLWRPDPKNPEVIQSNSRIIKWSDGSCTLQIASKPTEQYRISTTAMRPGWPKKQSSSQHHDYDPNRETNNYLAAPHATPGIDLQIVAPFDASMKIQPTGDTADEAEIQLRQSIASLSQQTEAPTAFKSVKEDPEMAKRAAEQFEKERAKADRRREAAQDRQFTRRDKVLGRSGLSRSGGAGLSVEGLEDEMPMARGSRALQKRRKSNRRGDIYSDDEDEDNYRARNRADEYDREDGFLADSDEEIETYEDDANEEAEAEDDDDPDHDDLVIEGRQTVLKGRTRGGARDRGRERTPKRTANDAEEDQDAEGEEDTEATKRPAPRKKRRVIDDEDEE